MRNARPQSVTTAQIGAEFVNILREWLTPAQFAEMQNANATEEPGICHSHDYCDANMAMLEALNRFGLGATFEANNEEHAATWNAAWAYAMTHGLGQTAAIEEAAAKADAEHPPLFHVHWSRADIYRQPLATACAIHKTNPELCAALTACKIGAKVRVKIGRTMYTYTRTH